MFEVQRKRVGKVHRGGYACSLETQRFMVRHVTHLSPGRLGPNRFPALKPLLQSTHVSQPPSYAQIKPLLTPLWAEFTPHVRSHAPL
jgi:hypothetical protein